MHSVLEPPDILTNTFPTNASMHLDVEVVANSQHNSLCLGSKLPSRREYQSLHPVKQENIIMKLIQIPALLSYTEKKNIHALRNRE